MSTIEELTKKINNLRSEMKTLSYKKNLAVKNDLYKNDPEYKEKIKLRNLKRYYEKIRPNKVLTYKKNDPVALEPLVDTQPKTIEFKCTYNE
jgi:hypothetical protein